MKIKIRSDSKQFRLPVRVLNSFPKDKELKLLDIGADSKYLRDFLPPNIKYYSLDYSGNHDYIFNLNKGKLPIKDKSFDIIVCLETLEHTLYPSRIMKEILRIAKDDAIFLLSMPNEYNFYCRLNFLLGKKTMVQEPFMTTEKNLHIHYPRIKDTVNFFSKYIDIKEIDYPWYSRTSFHNKGIKGKLYRYLDNFVSIFSKISPSLFSRTAVVKGIKKV